MPKKKKRTIEQRLREYIIRKYGKIGKYFG